MKRARQLWDGSVLPRLGKRKVADDLRHTFASVGVNYGHGLQVVGKLLGHTKILTTQRYAHLDDDPVRAANEQIGEHLSAMMTRKPEAEVVPLRSSAV